MRRGRAFGFLDGGRGLVAALLGSMMVVVFARLLPADVASATLAQRTAALTSVIWIFTGLTLGTAILVWFVVPDQDPSGDSTSARASLWTGIRQTSRMPAIWIQAGIVLCAYVGYKATDDFSLLARDTLGYDDVAAAQLGTISFWARPIAAVGAGLLGDRVGLSRVSLLSFALFLVGALVLALGVLQPGMHWLLLMTVLGTSLAIYAFRGFYFALFQEARVPVAVTGSAVGLVSIVGYTPDVFMGPLMGHLLDRSPGPLGHQHVFAVAAGFAVLGMILTLLFRRVAAANGSVDI